MKKRVLVYTDTFLKYSETFIYNQLIGVSEDFEVLLVSSRTLNGDKHSYPNTSHVPFDWIQRIQLLFNPYKFHNSYERKMKKVMQSFQPDMIHVHFGYNGIKILPLVSRLNIPMLITFWGSDASKRLNDRQYVKLLDEHFNYPKSLCCSNELKANLARSGFDTSNVQVHYAGVSVDRFPMTQRKPIAEKIASKGKIVFLQVSRFVGKKGHDITVKAFKNFLESSPEPDLFELRFVGEGQLMSRIVDLVKELGISKYVRFLGVKSSEEVTQEMINADVLLQHSVVAKDGDMEGLPIVIMEAMSVGLLVVSTYHSGIPELIKHGINGFLVNERDIAGYTNTLKSVLHLDNTNINQAARNEILQNFNMDIQNAKLASIYKEMIND